MGGKTIVGGVEGWYEAETGFICIVYPPGVADEDVARAACKITFEYASEFWARNEPVFILGDSRYATSTSPEARKVYGIEYKKAGRVYFASYRPLFTSRAFGKILLQAFTLIDDRFVGTIEADITAARAWLTKQRNAYLAEKSRRSA